MQLKLFLPFLFIVFISCQADKSERDISSLQTEIEDYLSRQDGEFAVWFKSMDHENLLIEINPDTLFHAASTMKTPVMIELFKHVEEGTISLDDSVVVENLFYSIVDSSEYSMELLPDSDDPIETMVGQTTTIGVLNHAMITYSSNLATNILIQMVGAEQTTQTMRELGAMNIQVLRGVEDLKAFDLGLSNRTTAKDLGIMFEHLAKGTAVSPESDSLMIEVLKEQFYVDSIPLYLPDDVTVANKTGFITGVRHDSGIIFLPDGRAYVLVILSKNLSDDDFGKEIGARVSKMIYEYIASL